MADDIISQIHEKKKKKMLSKSRSTMSDDDQIEYKAGWVVRKYLFDRDGKRSKSIIFLTMDIGIESVVIKLTCCMVGSNLH